MRRLITTLAVAALAIGFAGVSEAKAPQCKDASGKFIKCPEAPATPTVVRCRDKTTKKFAKCSAANTEPVPASTTAPAAPASPKPTPAPASTTGLAKPKPTTTPKP